MTEKTHFEYIVLPLNKVGRNKKNHFVIDDAPLKKRLYTRTN